MSAVVWWVVLIICFIISSAVINKLYQAYMHLMGAEVMFFSRKVKFGLILVLALVLFGLILKVLGVETGKN